MIESFLDGPQISTESIIINGQAFTPGFSDRNYEFLEKYAPYIIENGGDLPSFLSHKIQQEVKNTVEKAARSMGISTGVIKGDIVIHNSKANIIEIAARLSGGFFCSHEIPLNTGVDFLKAAIQIATGKTPDHRDLLPKHQKHVSQRYFFPYPGKILKIDNHQEVTEREGIAFLQIRVKKGDIIHPVHNHPARAGLVIAVGKNREEATKRAEKAVADIRIVTAP
jgi:biotin carboxylase